MVNVTMGSEHDQNSSIANRNLNKIRSRQSDRGKETQLMALNEPINAGSRYQSANVLPLRNGPNGVYQRFE